ncbi:substrate-binding domain-containing protein [Actinomyces sp.]|uniref:substrate-binding domain-containing protein n=1 Tax=Actinomyces sp. TaxID=29317 RepID=UPI002915997D|nr:substrate-binding domain-containing protein [Actinomyces sp.]MDU6679389.1 substrate-binding domain-containing protein [Actinomyces sp.]
MNKGSKTGAQRRVNPVNTSATTAVEAARVATEHLLKQGAQKIAVLGHQEDRTQATSRLRFQGYEKALAGAGIPQDPNLIGTVIDTIYPHMGTIANTALNKLFGPTSPLEDPRQKHVITEFELIMRT